MKTRLDRLVRFNLYMGFVHLVQGVLMLVLASSVIEKIGEFKPMVTKYFLRYDFDTSSLVTDQTELFRLPFGIMVALFLFVSAGAHFLVVLNKKKYTSDLERKINVFRWYEYAISSSIMIVLISTLFGVYDVVSLILIFLINASMNLFGLLMEEMNSLKGKINWKPFVFGSIAGAAPWLAIIIYMTGTGNYDLVPWFVWAILISYFFAFNTFPINMILQYKGVGKWKDYLYGERVYIILSLIAKTILAWLVLFGAMQP